MSDYYLRAESEAAMNASLLAAGLVDHDGNAMPGIDISVIGIVRKDGIAIPGWHVNIRSATGLLESQVSELPVIPVPAAPVRMWFDHA